MNNPTITIELTSPPNQPPWWQAAFRDHPATADRRGFLHGLHHLQPTTRRRILDLQPMLQRFLAGHPQILALLFRTPEHEYPARVGASEALRLRCFDSKPTPQQQ